MAAGHEQGHRAGDRLGDRRPRGRRPAGAAPPHRGHHAEDRRLGRAGRARRRRPTSSTSRCAIATTRGAGPRADARPGRLGRARRRLRRSASGPRRGDRGQPRRGRRCDRGRARAGRASCRSAATRRWPRPAGACCSSGRARPRRPRRWPASPRGVMCCEQPAYAPAAWAALLAPLAGRRRRGRAGRVARRPRPRARAWPTCSTARCCAGAVAVAPDRCHRRPRGRAADGGRRRRRSLRRHPAARRPRRRASTRRSSPRSRRSTSTRSSAADGAPATIDPVVLEVLPPDPATMDLAEAASIVGGGAGLGQQEVMDLLGDVADRAAAARSAAPGSITDWGWLPFERQIGTTGVIVHPELYLAFGISGAVQHVSRPRRPGPRHRRQHRRQLPDDGDRRPGRRHRRAGPRGRAGPPAPAPLLRGCPDA